jgi:hypothetical protein
MKCPICNSKLSVVSFNNSAYRFVCDICMLDVPPSKVILESGYSANYLKEGKDENRV